MVREAITDEQFLCQNKAEKYGIRTARLPIGKYLADLPTRKVLTVNQVSQPIHLPRTKLIPRYSLSWQSM
jgi:hypothetical protein